MGSKRPPRKQTQQQQTRTTMENYKAVVDDTLAAYPNQIVENAQEEAGKAQLTRMSAYRIAQLNPNIGLLRKPSGNNILKLSVDYIVDKSNGDATDIASSTPVDSTHRRITVVWIPKAGTGPMSEYHPQSNPDGTWVRPSVELSNVAGPLGTYGGEVPDNGGGDGGGGSTPTDPAINEKLDVIISQQAVISQKLDMLAAQSDANTSKIQNQIGALVEDVEDTMKQVLPLITCRFTNGEAPAGVGGGSGVMGGIGELLSGLFRRSRQSAAQSQGDQSKTVVVCGCPRPQDEHGHGKKEE